MASLFRETELGALLRLTSFGRRLLPYPEELDSFVLPDCTSATEKKLKELPDECLPRRPPSELGGDIEGASVDLDGPTVAPTPALSTKEDVKIVDWYSELDPENPKNWSEGKKLLVLVQIGFFTFAVYGGSAIISSSFQGLIADFGINQQEATLTISMFVLAYGIGPLLFSPLSEIPHFGRNVWYIYPMFLFVLLQIGAALTPTFAGLVVLRFLTGFFGSPILASGGASVADLYAANDVPLRLSFYCIPAFFAPAVTPVIGNYASTLGWRWPMYELLILSGLATALIFVALPETSADNILLRRARRLRALTGDESYRSRSEVAEEGLTIQAILVDAIIKPFEISVLDPSITFSHLYIALIYSIYYTFFDAFPILYGEVYQMSWGSQGLMYLPIAIGTLVGFTFYGTYLIAYINPRLRRGIIFAPEKRLETACIASVMAPIGLFIFAWTARADVHWIGSAIGSAIFVAANLVTFQCVFLYIILAYDKYAASLLAANDFLRSAIAASILHAGHPLFTNPTLHLSGGVSLLGGLVAALGIPGIWAIWRWGHVLRSRSRFAQA